MDLHEHQSKEIFSRYGVPVPGGKVAARGNEARDVAVWLGTRVAVKAQVLTGGRGKAGGIRMARTPGEAKRAAQSILGTRIKGLPVRQVLVEEAAEIAREVYLGLVIDRSARRVVLMASAEGGVEIEEVARATPSKIVRTVVDPALGLRDYQLRAVGLRIGLESRLAPDFVQIGHALHRAFADSDASLAEINPLVITPSGSLLGVDGKMVLDDNALFRHPDLAALRPVDEEDPLERAARLQGLTYVRLDGKVGCMVNGAGLAMATMDIIQRYGGAPANFLDVGGGARAASIASAMHILLSDQNVRAVLLNVFGGITRCDEVAEGIVHALREIGTEVPIIARLVGTNQAAGQRILSDASVVTADSLADAARLAVAEAEGADS